MGLRAHYEGTLTGTMPVACMLESVEGGLTDRR